MALDRLLVHWATTVLKQSPARQFHTTSLQSFHFLKKQVTIDPEVARKREERKRRKLEKAVRDLKKYADKPKPVQELQLDLRVRSTLEQRQRTKDETEVPDEEQFERVYIAKQYQRERSRLAKTDIYYIQIAIKKQQRALEVLKAHSPKLYEEALVPDHDGLPLIMQGPSLLPPIADYRSPDGDYKDSTKQWVQPRMESLSKIFGYGKLIVVPGLRKQEAKQQQTASTEKKAATG